MFRKPVTAFVVTCFFTLLAGCGSSSSSVAPTPPGSPVISLSATTFAFSNTIVGQTSASQTLTVTNTGSATATLGGYTLGANSTDYNISVSTCGTSLAANASCTLTIAFTPQTTGALPSSVTITDNASNSPQSVTLTGTGTATATPVLTVSPASLAFGSVTVGTTSTAQAVTLTNTGAATLTFNSTITLSDSSDYALTTTCGASLASGGSCTLSVSFKPQTAAALNGTVNLANNATGSPQTIALSGTGTAAATPTATLSATSLTFTGTVAGTSSAAQTVMLSNTGGATLTGISITLGGTNAASFGDTTTCTATLAAGATCAISVTFSPAAAGTFAASISIADNASGAPQSITLNGAATAAAAAAQAMLSTNSLTFAATTIGSSAGAQSVMLSNPGGATLTGIAISIGGGTASSAFTDTTTCGTTLAAGANCSIAVNFTPGSTGNYAATMSVADSATGSPQTVALSGSGQNAPAPIASFSSTSVSFPATQMGTTATLSNNVTLTNTGNATLSISSIALGGTNSAYFTETNTCGATLAANASCNFSMSFTPPAASTYTATITINDNAAGSPQSITLNGTGTATAISHQLYVFGPSATNGLLTPTPLYTLINNAQKTVDMTMYELQDTVFSGDLVADCARGVVVRVVLSSSEKSSNTPAYTQLNGAGANCSAIFSNTAFTNTHQKTITVDNATTAILSLNLQTQYYSTTRDFAMIENDPVDIAAIEATFAQDYAAGTPSGGTQGASDFSYKPGPGDDLIWSPTTAQADMLALINNAKSTILLENEEMSAGNIVSALETACQNGVIVQIAMVNDSTNSPYSSYATNFKALEAAGCGVKTYPDTTTGLYIHAKALVADYGLSTQSVYMGSINYSIASMTQNRELGLYITDTPSISAIYTTMVADYAGATTF
jgi:phosphatidylserine/phosphatidylglycerophosphate/cardiolipin synthase-like enzyme